MLKKYVKNATVGLLMAKYICYCAVTTFGWKKLVQCQKMGKIYVCIDSLDDTRQCLVVRAVIHSEFDLAIDDWQPATSNKSLSVSPLGTGDFH